MPDFDCLIIGGGMVGASLALALKDQPIRIGVVEARQPSGDGTASYDDRGLVLAPSSRRILTGIGVWPQLAREATPVREIRISDRGHFGSVCLHANLMDMDALGHVIIGRVLARVLLNNVGAADNLQLLCPAQAENVRVTDEVITVQLKMDGKLQSVTTRLLVVADGAHSQTRHDLGVKIQEHDYEQTAVVTNVTPAQPHGNIAYERFTNTGPLALIPSTLGRYVVVWTVPSEQAAAFISIPEEDFIEGLYLRLGRRLPRMTKLGRRIAYPLRQTLAKQNVGQRFAIIGNAAHTLHPNGAQGLNLGLRDAAVLAELVAETVAVGGDPGDPGAAELLSTYAQRRQQDQRNITRFSHGLTQLFYNDFAGAAWLRNAAMLGVDIFPALKRALTRRAMGLQGDQPRLVRGLPLREGVDTPSLPASFSDIEHAG